ncbi:hypothetical protein HRG84_05320 [Flavisolibacter sp. BT320]|nr:hypothetical protein [Flavisolibacter longurius]
MLITVFAWLPMLLLAVGNGVFREAVLRKRMALEKAHQVSTLLLISLLGMYSFLFVRWYPPASAGKALLTGAAWVVLTLLFEVGFGRYRGISWQTMLQEYNLFKGKLWALVPLSILLLPLLFFVIQKD